LWRRFGLIANRKERFTRNGGAFLFLYLKSQIKIKTKESCAALRRAGESEKGVVVFPSASSWLRCARVMVRRSLMSRVGLRARGVAPKKIILETQEITCAMSQSSV
jgi:hypothetical protein